MTTYMFCFLDDNVILYIVSSDFVCRKNFFLLIISLAN
jgi:hypothetical protein